jgi:outer membrane protein TolC
MKKILLFICVLHVLCGVAFAQTLKVGIVLDGPSKALTDLVDSIDNEVKKLLSEDELIEISKNNIQIGKFTESSIKSELEKLYRNKKIDAIIALGPVASDLICHQKSFSKPCFAAHILNSKMQSLEPLDGTSGIENLSYVDHEIHLEKHFDKFQEIISVEKIHVLLSDYMVKALPALKEYFNKIAKDQNLEVEIIPVTNNIRFISRKFKKAQAIFVGPLVHLDSAAKDKLIRMINEAKIPSITLMGKKAVEEGIFASILTEIDPDKVARRLAVNLHRTLLADEPADFNVSLSAVERLTINMETARKIGVYPTWEQMTDAILLNNERQDIRRELSINKVINIALKENLTLIAKRQELEAGVQKIKRARSQFKPKLSVYGRETVLDQDRADSMSSPAEYSAKLGADLVQVIFSDQAKANIDIQKLLHSSQKEEERALILDIIRDASLAYLNVLKAKTLVAIQKDNLEVTRKNLEIAKFREKIGISAPAEVYRWEIQMAGARQAVIDATVMRKKSELALNQLLSAPQEAEFRTANQNIYDQVFVLKKQHMVGYLDNLKGYKVVRDFLVEDTFKNSPEIKQIEKGIKAQRRLKLANHRRYNSPTIALQGNFERTFHEKGKGETKPTLPPPFNAAFKYPDKNDWYVGVNISMPLYEGGDRKAAIKETKAMVDKLKADLQSVKQKLELNTRVKLEDARGSYCSIKLSSDRAEYASKTLDLVQSAYTRGAVNILDLIDAQNASLVSKEASANAVFNFLSDFIRVCRAVGDYDFILNKPAFSSWYKRLEKYFNARDRRIIREVTN